uniref:Uncharacterized protein n=1 Tax=viral metagenome TaxID=1070528 RepID=A0A6H1ZCW3_9ZZZZ
MSFAIGNKELGKKKNIGDFILCKSCNKRHRIKYGDKILENGTKKPSKLLGFYTCQGKNYLASIAGKDIRR